MNSTIAALIVIFFALAVLWFRVAIRGGSIKKIWLPTVLAVFLGWNILVPLVFRSATYHGKVVDEETGESLADAVVAVIWYHSPIIEMEHTKSFQAAKETATNTDGTFSLWTWSGLDFNPFTTVDVPPEVIIYKAGYGPLQPGTTYGGGFRTFEDLADALKRGTIIKLPKLKTREEARRFTDVHAIGVRSDRLPKLFHEVNAHRKALGITSLIY